MTRLSNCVRARDPAGSWRVVDALSRLPSLAFFIEQPSFPDADTARIYLEYVESARFATGYDCRLGRTAEGWEVQDCQAGFPR